MKVLEGKSVFSGIAIGRSQSSEVDASVKRVHDGRSGRRGKACGGSQRAGCGTASEAL